MYSNLQANSFPGSVGGALTPSLGAANPVHESGQSNHLLQAARGDMPPKAQSALQDCQAALRCIQLIEHHVDHHTGYRDVQPDRPGVLDDFAVGRAVVLESLQNSGNH